MSTLHRPILRWYADHARDLPWRRPEASAWSVLVSELMLQQTPVARVLPVHEAWVARWPTPAALAAEPVGEAVRAWGRLGYPRRALRLHAAATVIVERHGGEVPASHDELLALPGVGDYTAAAVASFAFGQRHVVLDTNVRRVFGRALAGIEFPPPAPTRVERDCRGRDPAGHSRPPRPGRWRSWSSARSSARHANPRCDDCPIADQCAWLAAGRPAYDGPPRRSQAWTGTDRQCRGRLMAVLRQSDGVVHASRLEAVWAHEPQRTRCLDSLVADGLAERVTGGGYTLPRHRAAAAEHTGPPGSERNRAGRCV